MVIGRRHRHRFDGETVRERGDDVGALVIRQLFALSPRNLLHVLPNYGLLFGPAPHRFCSWLHNANHERSQGESRAGEKRKVSLTGSVIDVTAPM
jgi:hypothetical protein